MNYREKKSWLRYTKKMWAGNNTGIQFGPRFSIFVM